MRTRGMTLLELMVAMTIFLVLGAGLVMFLRVGIQTWRVGERRREIYERGQAILGQLASDLVGGVLRWTGDSTRLSHLAVEGSVRVRQSTARSGTNRELTIVLAPNQTGRSADRHRYRLAETPGSSPSLYWWWAEDSLL